MKVIDIENHFVTHLWIETLKNNKNYPKFDDKKGLGYYDDSWMPVTDSGTSDKLLDLGEDRLKLMDKVGIDYAHLSLTAPGAESFDVETSKKVAKDANDTIAKAVKKYPDRIGGFITLAPKDPEWSVKEIERCVNELGLWGWHTHSNYGDSYLDEKRYWPILKKCEELGMPIYLHPTVTAAKDLREFGICLSSPTFGFGVDTQYCFLRMIHRGVFDAFPKLKVILGHFGETLPFTADRVNAAYRQGYGQPLKKIDGGYSKAPEYYIRHNLWTTSSGNYLPQALYCTRDVLGKEKVIMATDYPYEKIELGVDMIVNDNSLPDEEKELYLCDNAKALGFGKNI